MGLFPRKREVTPRQMASEIWGALVQIMQHEFDEAREFDREKFRAEQGWDYDKKHYVGEHSFIYAFLIHNEVPRFFPEKGEPILTEFREILKDNDMGFLLEGVEDYQKAWDSAIARQHEIDDDSTLNNPSYCISKLASIRCFGEKEGLDVRKIIMFTTCINPFVGMLHENFKRYKVV